jgi:23S rRNA pseudouridine2605 synthase
MTERIQKILAQAGVCSRRAAEQLMQQGRVTVNGKKAAVGDQADPETDHIQVDGKRVGLRVKHRYLMLYKPRGYVTTMHDDLGRRDVSMLVKGNGRLYPVGRLDYDSEGLLLLTNDGELTHKLTHPSHEVTKTYLVRVSGDLSRLDELRQPMELDGYTIRPAEVSIDKEDESGALLRVVIHEGRNRQIRKMCEACGFTVRRLKRVAEGELELDRKLSAGKWRELTEEEVQYLQNL